MISSTTLPKVNKNCVYCVTKITESYYVLSDQSYIHKPCLQMLRVAFSDVGLDQDMRQFYNFILQKVVNCTKCKNPLDRVNSYMTSPYCSACKPLNIFEVKRQTEYCELCDQQITLKNKLKKPPLIQGIVMCATCYKVQTGEQDEELQIKPDLREIKPLFKLNKEKEEKTNNIFTNIVNFKPEKQKEKIKIQQFQQIIPLKKVQKQTYSICKQCCKQTNFLQLALNNGFCNNCQGLNDSYEKQEDYYDEYFGLQHLFEEKKQKKAQKKHIHQQKLVVQKVQIKKEVEVTKPIKEEKHNYLLKQCKICFNAQSTMINTQCRHLMMCQLCYKAMLKRQNKKHQLCCPVCQTVGKYYKYLQPIYI